VLVAVVQSIIPISGFPGLFGTGFIHSHNGGLGWSSDANPTLFVPGLPNPPVLAAQGDIVYCCWASGGVPQFLASQDGGLVLVLRGAAPHGPRAMPPDGGGDYAGASPLRPQQETLNAGFFRSSA
jgi:hypothetical protein